MALMALALMSWEEASGCVSKVGVHFTWIWNWNWNGHGNVGNVARPWTSVLFVHFFQHIFNTTTISGRPRTVDCTTKHQKVRHRRLRRQLTSRRNSLRPWCEHVDMICSRRGYMTWMMWTWHDMTIRVETRCGPIDHHVETRSTTDIRQRNTLPVDVCVDVRCRHGHVRVGVLRHEFTNWFSWFRCAYDWLLFQ